MNLLPKRMGGIGIAFCAWATFVAVPLYSQRENVKLRRLELDLSGDASIEYDDNLNTIWSIHHRRYYNHHRAEPRSPLEDLRD